MNITDILHKTFGKEAEKVVEDIAAAVIPQAEAAAETAVRNLIPVIQQSLTSAIIPAIVGGLEGAGEKFISGKKLIVTVEVLTK